jgi:hypothetical protein
VLGVHRRCPPFRDVIRIRRDGYEVSTVLTTRPLMRGGVMRCTPLLSTLSKNTHTRLPHTYSYSYIHTRIHVLILVDKYTHKRTCKLTRTYSLKIWNLEDPHVRTAISKSYSEPRKPGNAAFQTYTEQLPVFSSVDVHTGYVGKFFCFLVKKIM